jgi:hypothetical protein
MALRPEAEARPALEPSRARRYRTTAPLSTYPFQPSVPMKNGGQLAKAKGAGAVGVQDRPDRRVGVGLSFRGGILASVVAVFAFSLLAAGRGGGGSPGVASVASFTAAATTAVAALLERTMRLRDP